MFIALQIVRRAWIAARVVGKLVADRSTRRRFPWRYVRSRFLRDWRLTLQMTSIVLVVVLWPVGAVLQGTANGILVAIALVAWSVSMLSTWAQRGFRFRRPARRRRVT